MHNDFYYRSEDISLEELDSIYVQTETDSENIEFLKERTPGLLIGSRGTGKTMLLKVVEKQFDNNFEESRDLGIMVSFKESMLLKSINDQYYFRQWMISKILFMLKRKLKKLNISIPNKLIAEYFSGSDEKNITDQITSLIKIFEESWKNKEKLNIDQINNIIDLNGGNAISDIDYFLEFIDELCESLEIKKIFILFDEACHNFIPIQQREFFTLFRDLRCSKICCKAAVYPGITNYGTLQPFHDVKSKKVERDITNKDYRIKMREIVEKQINDKKIYNKLIDKGNLFDTLIYSCSGNPRLLLKSLDLCMEENGSLKTAKVSAVIKDFYRKDIWNEHTRLSNIYSGHKELIDWGRNFIENNILPLTWDKNSKIFLDKDANQTLTFVVHRDSPNKVKSAIKILEYTGIVCIVKEGIRMKYDLYDRYKINLGVVIASETTNNIIKSIDIPSRCNQILTNLNNTFDTECGKNSTCYRGIESVKFINENTMENEILQNILKKEIEALELTSFLIDRMKSIDINTVGDILMVTEKDLQSAKFIGDIRSKSIYNKAYNAAIEYISG